MAPQLWGPARCDELGDCVGGGGAQLPGTQDCGLHELAASGFLHCCSLGGFIMALLTAQDLRNKLPKIHHRGQPNADLKFVTRESHIRVGLSPAGDGLGEAPALPWVSV